jgi:hypothetical protein
MGEEDNMKKEDLKNIADILKEVPIYPDAIQPAAKEVGKALTTIAKTVNIALAPLKVMVWGYDQVEEFLTSKLTEKLNNTPSENIVTPPTYLAGPAIEALRFSGNNEELRELYANLIATSMDRNSTDKAHPAFVDIIRNLTPAEARLLSFFVKEDNIPLININKQEEDGSILLVANYTLLNEYLNLESDLKICTYITNLCRLGILEIPSGVYLAKKEIYNLIENSKTVNEIKTMAEEEGKSLKIDRRLLRLTRFGKDFITCVIGNEKE